jgi:hypothetical protein
MFRRGVKILLLFMVLGTFVLAGNTSAEEAAAVDISRAGTGARPLGLGRAYTALADDADAVLLNPAGTAYLRSISLMSIQSQFLNDVYYSTYALAWPTEFGTFGFGYVNTAINNINIAEWRGADPVIVGQAEYANNVFIASYARTISDELALGVGLKQFSQQFSNLNVKGSSAQGYNADIGLMYKFPRDWSMGLVWQNCYTGPSLRWDNDTQEILESHAKAGIAYQWRKAPNWLDLDRMVYVFDVDIPVAQTYQFSTYHTGAELWFGSVFAVRLGAGTRQAWIGGHPYSLIEPALGLGLDLWGLRVDYTYFPGAQDLADKAEKFFLSLSYQLPGGEALSPQNKREEGRTEGKAGAEQTLETGVQIKETQAVRPYYNDAEVGYKVLRRNIITIKDVMGDKAYDQSTAYFEQPSGERAQQLRLPPGETWFSYELGGKEHLAKIMVIKDYVDISERTPGYSAIQALTMGGILGGHRDNHGRFEPYLPVDQGEFEDALSLIQQGRFRYGIEPPYRDNPISRREAVMMVANRFGGDMERYLALFPKQEQSDIMEGRDGGSLQRFEMAELLVLARPVQERLLQLAQEYDLKPYEVYISGIPED